MDQLFQGIFLAIVAFLLGLVRDAFNKAESHRKKRLTYSKEKILIVDSDKASYGKVRSRITDKEIYNIGRFKVRVENAGKLSVSNVSLLIRPNKSAAIVDYKITTDPPNLVEYSETNTSGSNSIRIDNISLRTKQSILIDVCLESKEEPTLNVYWSNEDDVEILEHSVGGIHSLEESLIGIIRNYIFAIISPGLITGIFYFLSSLLILLGSSLYLETLLQDKYVGNTISNNIQIIVIYLGECFGNLLALYFYLRIIPYVLSLVRNFARHKNFDNIFEDSLNGIIRNYIFAIISPRIFGIIITILYTFFFTIYSVFAYKQSMGYSELNNYSQSFQLIMAIGNVVGTLVGIYFYLRIIPYALRLVRNLVKNKIITKQ